MKKNRRNHLATFKAKVARATPRPGCFLPYGQTATWPLAALAALKGDKLDFVQNQCA